MRNVLFAILIGFVTAVCSPGAKADSTAEQITSTEHIPGRWHSCVATSKTVLFGSLTYIRDVVLTGGLRLFLRSHGPKDEKSFRFFVFREAQREGAERWYSDIPGRFLQFVPRWLSRKLGGSELDFVPVQGSFEYLIRKPITATVSALTLKKLKIRPTLLTEFAYFAVIAAVSIHYFVDVPFFNAKNQQLVQQIQASEELSHMIESDFRFRAIKQDLADGVITDEEARLAAAGLRLNITSYQHWVTSTDEGLSVSKDESTILQLPLFSELKSVFRNGLKSQEGYSFERLGPLSMQQKESLFALQNAYLYQMDIATLHIDSPEALSSEPPAHIKQILASINEDAYFQALQHFYKKGYISKAQLKWRLQEDIFWRFKFAKYKVLGITKLKKQDDGSYSDVAVTIDDIRSQSIEEMKRNYRATQI